MSATAIAGKGGSVQVVGTPNTTIGEIREWQLTVTRAGYDKTALGDDFESKVIGVGSWTGQLTGFFAIESDAGQTVLNNAILTGTQLYVELKTATSTYEGQVNPTQVQVGNPVDNVVSFQFSFDGNGALLFT